MSATLWTDPRIVSEAHAWLRDAASRSGRQVVGEIAQPHVRPWSTVFRAATDQGDVYLKLCAPSQDFEPALTALLARVRAELVPDVLAVHPREPWMLLADGGTKIGELLNGPALLDAWATMLPRYADLQRALGGQVEAIRATGIPDRTLARLANDLHAVLDDDRVSGVAGIPPPDRRAEVRTLLPEIGRRSGELAALGIEPTVHHDDLHEANLLVKGGRVVIFDWGDSSLSHPFLSLGVPLEFAARRTGLDPTDPRILRLRDAYLEPWTAAVPRAALERAADLGARLSTITRSLSWYRVITLDEGALAAEPGALGKYLEGVIRAFSTGP